MSASNSSVSSDGRSRPDGDVSRRARKLSGVRGRWSDRDAQPVVVDPQAAIESTTVESLIEASHIVTYTAGRGSVRQQTAGVEGRQRVSTQWTGT